MLNDRPPQPGPAVEPTAADLLDEDPRAGRDLLAQIQEANGSRAGGWIATDLVGNPINDDHTWKDVR